MRSPRVRFISTTFPIIAASAFAAQPHYVELGWLPVPTATERTELFDTQTRTWFSFPSYGQGDLTVAFKAAHAGDGSLNWVPSTSFPARTTYWGREATDGKHVYFTGRIDNVSKYAAIRDDGALGAWQDMSGLPTPAGGRGRALHQAFIRSALRDRRLVW